ncbi:kinase-like domain-containing protein [Ephemerocybe angulata]|uniref:Kinase-like domain-containing protein n=1 Tax=Ephemerocybe angulata TaxID=980116 RepID=A0A8H6LZ83_9AGAR|nr:kinase-like domain-containing protein [Tulosesus angulatus]
MATQKEGPLTLIKCNDCRKSFALWDANPQEPVCPKCTQLACHPRDSEDYRDIMRWPQCKVCGDTFRNMVTEDGVGTNCGSDICSGDTAMKENERSASPESKSASAHRRLAGRIPDSHKERSTALQTLYAQANLRAGNHGLVVLHWKYRQSDKARTTNDALGSGLQGFGFDTTLTDVTEVMLSSLNAEMKAEVSPRLCGNVTFQSGTLNLTLQELIVHYQKAGGSDAYFKPTVKPKGKPSSGSLEMHLELFVYMDEYRRRIEYGLNTSSDDDDASVPQKRRARKSSGAKAGKEAKQARSTVPTSMLKSQFKRSTAQGLEDVEETTRVEFRKIICNIDEEGTVSYAKTDYLSGYLADEPMAHSGMKSVYKLIGLGSDRGTSASTKYVAKRFYRIEGGKSGEPVPVGPDTKLAPFAPAEHNILIRAEASRLALGARILTDFKKHAQFCGVVVDEDICFARSFLLQEIKSKPSPASGMLSYNANVKNEEFDGLMWLIEELRNSKSTHHYSGTLGHPSDQSDMTSLTSYSFAHFGYGCTNNEKVFADIQATPALVNGNDGHVFFDPMTHTVKGDSGIGDHGIPAIEIFIRDHRCRDICRRLGLDRAYPLSIKTIGMDEDEQKKAKKAEKKKKAAAQAAPKRATRSQSRAIDDGSGSEVEVEEGEIEEGKQVDAAPSPATNEN